jgi:hypothetical protein
VLARKNELDETEELYDLPPHQRCAAHTMDLIAVNDSEAACNDAAYKKIFRCSMAKCTALWNKG